MSTEVALWRISENLRRISVPHDFAGLLALFKLDLFSGIKKKYVASKLRGALGMHVMISIQFCGVLLRVVEVQPHRSQPN